MAPLPPFPDSARLGHARSLDGIRGIAVLAVLGHNLKFGWLQGGFFGVDMFFALSGFLITTLLLEEQLVHGAISLPNFFRRRFLRLYPALIVVALAAGVSSLTRPDVGLPRVSLVVGSTLLYFSNWVILADSEAWVGGLGHTWSLAVEMHFYVLWAVAFVFVFRRAGPNLKLLLLLALGTAGASAAWRMVAWTGTDNLVRLYSGTDTRLDAVFLGVAAALLRLRWALDPGPGSIPTLPRVAVRACESLAAVGVGWLVVRTPEMSPIAFLGGFALVGGATALVILTTLLSPHSLLAAPLQSPVLVWFGQISYSLYLWHVPVGKIVTHDRLGRFGVTSWQAGALGAAASIAIAAASYYGIERVFARLRHKARA